MTVFYVYFMHVFVSTSFYEYVQLLVNRVLYKYVIISVTQVPKMMVGDVSFIENNQIRLKQLYLLQSRQGWPRPCHSSPSD